MNLWEKGDFYFSYYNKSVLANNKAYATIYPLNLIFGCNAAKLNSRRTSALDISNEERLSAVEKIKDATAHQGKSGPQKKVSGILGRIRERRHK